MKDNPFRSGVSLKPAAAKSAPTPAPTAARRKGLRATIIDGPDGEIVHIEQGERYPRRGEARKDRARVTIRHGEPPKPPKKGDSIDTYEDVKTTELHLNPSQLAGLKVGDKVSIHLKKH